MVTLQQVRTAEGLEFEVAVSGNLANPIVMLHGYGDSWYSFNGMLQALPQDMSAVSITQRGYGHSAKPEDDYSIQRYARDALGVMDALAISRAPIVGHSMGTFIAQEIALTAPSRVSHLVLIASAVTADNDVVAELAEAVADLTDPMPREFVHEFQAGTCANPLGPGMTLERIVDESMLAPAHVWRQALEGLRTYRPRSSDPDLSGITCPTLILWGDQDEIFLADEQTRLNDKISGSALKIYEDIGHGLQWERPEEATADLLAFLADNPV
jgi:pimeloyl-ACP methyl ester carboxylesterase